jgi:hypothetical protein
VFYFGNINGSQGSTEIKMQFVLAMGLCVTKAGKLFSAAIKELYLEPALVVIQNIVCIQFRISTKVKFGGLFSLCI